MTDNSNVMFSYFIRESIDKETLLARALQIVKRAARESCCLCRDSCFACDALNLLKEIGVDRNG